MPGFYSKSPTIKAPSQQAAQLLDQVRSGDTQAVAASSSAIHDQLNLYEQLEDNYFASSAEQEKAIQKLKNNFYMFFRHVYVPECETLAEQARRAAQDNYDPLSDIQVSQHSVKVLSKCCKAFLL